MEIFKDIIGYEGIYQVSSFRKHSPYLTLSRDKDGYLFCGLKGKSFRVHRIVAMAFIITPKINHV